MKAPSSGPSAFDNASTPLVAGALVVKSFGGSRIYPNQGRYTVGELKATVNDDGGYATQWCGTERPGGSRTYSQPAVLYLGSAELPEEYYEPVWSGFIEDITTGNGAASYEVTGLSLLAGWDQEIMVNCLQVDGSVRVADGAEPYDGFEGNSDLSSENDAYNGYRLKFSSGANEGQEFEIADYEAVNRRITLATGAVNPINTNDRFSIYNYVQIVGNPVNIFARIILDDFALSGSVQDDWPLDSVTGTAPTGIGLDPSVLDTEQMQGERDFWALTMKLRLQWAEPERARETFEDEIFKILGAYPIISVDGKFRIRMGRPLRPQADPPFEVSKDVLEGIPKWKRQTSEIITGVKVWGDLNLATNEYQLLADHKTLDTRYLDTALHKTKTIEIKSRGLASDLNGRALAEAIADRLLARFGTGGPEEIQGTGTPRAAFLEAGERIAVTHARLPNLGTGKLGKVGQAFEVVQVSVDAASLQPKLTLVGFYPSGRPGFIAPDTVAETYAAATDADKQYAYNSPATGTFPDGADAYLVI